MSSARRRSKSPNYIFFSIKNVVDKKSKKIIQNSSAKKFLVSREFDIQLEDELKWFCSTYPQARIIIIFRRHDEWIESQYKRHVKNGWFYNFDSFFNLENDEGLWERKNLEFCKMISMIEKYAHSQPLVLFHDELNNNPWKFLERISSFTGTTFSRKDIKLKKVHTSYSEKQLLVLRSFCRNVIRKAPVVYRQPLKHWLLFRPWWTLFHLIMYIASVFPKFWVPSEKLIDPVKLEEIKSAYAKDWKKVKRYAESEINS